MVQKSQVKILLAILSGFAKKYEFKALVDAFKRIDVSVTPLFVDRLSLRIDTTGIQMNLPIPYAIEEYQGIFIREIFPVFKTFGYFLELIKQHNPNLKVIDNNIFNDGYITNKIRQLVALQQHGIKIPRTLYFVGYEQLVDSLSYIRNYLGFPLLVKHRSAGKGAGIYKADTPQHLLQILDHIQNEVGHPIGRYYLQEFLPLKHDYRILVIGKTPLGAMLRIPKKGEYRANYSLGGTVKPAQLTPLMKETAIKAVKALDLDFAGVDLVETQNNEFYILEVNKSPGFEGFTKALNIDVAMHIAKFVKQKIQDGV